MATEPSPGDPASQGSAHPSFRSPLAPALNSTLVGNNADDSHDTGLVGSSSSSSSVHTSHRPTPLNANFRNAQALQPPFRPPLPGQLTVAQVMLTHEGIRRSIPVFIYTSLSGNAQYVYPVTRPLLGKVWHTPAQLAQCEFYYCHEEPIRFCARRADLPPEMIQGILVSLESNGGGAQLDLQRLQIWHDDLRNPQGRITIGVPCTHCGTVNQVRLAELLPLTGISEGVSCAQLGRRCVRDAATRWQVTATQVTTNTFATRSSDMSLATEAEASRSRQGCGSVSTSSTLSWKSLH